MEEYLLESSRLRVCVLPGEGGRIGSVRSNLSGVEFLAQPYQQRSDWLPSVRARFSHGYCAGIEECLPSVGPCDESTDGGAVPDHGDFWQLDWDVTNATQTSLTCSAFGFSRPLRFEKRIAVEENRLSIHYGVQNIGSLDASVLYACHPLLAVEPGDRVCLPAEGTSWSVNYSGNLRMGQPGDTVTWPITSAGIDADVVLSQETRIADMLYSARLNTGRCGLYRAASGQGISLHFDTSELPFLGVWLCFGGWPSDSESVSQYAVALEPTFAPVNTLNVAQGLGLARSIAPDQSIAWSITFEVSDPGISLEQFWPVQAL